MGLIHVYCGDGKGKTTAALGLAMRASGAGMKVVIIQFLKGSDTAELKSLKKLSNITMLRNTKDLGFVGNMTPEQIETVTAMHNENLYKALRLVNDGECDMLILDELTYAYDMKLVDVDRIDELLNHKPEHLELIVTGRNPADIFVDNADYITEMMAVRHPFDKGISARKGIEY